MKIDTGYIYKRKKIHVHVYLTNFPTIYNKVGATCMKKQVDNNVKTCLGTCPVLCSEMCINAYSLFKF